jgi:hypothetical protein
MATCGIAIHWLCSINFIVEFYAVLPDASRSPPPGALTEGESVP